MKPDRGQKWQLEKKAGDREIAKKKCIQKEGGTSQNRANRNQTKNSANLMDVGLKLGKKNGG